MDAASGLVEAYLHMNGYLTLSEWQIQAMNRHGQWETITDVDVLGLRFPGDVYLADSHDPNVQSQLEVRGHLLLLEEGAIDVVIGEIKEGEAVFNPALTRHETLHTVLHRLAWLYDHHGLDEVVRELAKKGTCFSPAPGGGRVRTRRVAFGQSSRLTENTIPIGRIVEEMTELLADHDAMLRSAQFSNPVAATLKLLHKVGFDVGRQHQEGEFLT